MLPASFNIEILLSWLHYRSLEIEELKHYASCFLIHIIYELIQLYLLFSVADDEVLIIKSLTHKSFNDMIKVGELDDY